MDKQYEAHRRKKRYMGQILTAFENDVEPHIPREVAEAFKGLVRQKLHALTLDAIQIFQLKPGEEQNGHAVELRDTLDIRPRSTTA